MQTMCPPPETKASKSKQHVVIAAIIRNNEIIVPRGISSFEVGDEVLLLTDSEGADQIKDLFEATGQSV